ncbi:MAG: hypothetical protein ACE5KV_04835, partial [Thermoplasmata archaeon]
HFLNHSIHYVNNSDNTTTFFGEISFGTNPVSNDTDLDGLLDGDEITSQNSTDPLDPDSDDDFLLDGSNITVESETDPRHQAFQDNYIIRFNNTYAGELSFGTNQSSPDSDEDDLPDGWEVRFFLDPTDNSTLNSSGNGDLDNDELTNLAEFLYETHPRKWDTDGDTLPDVWELQCGLDPLWNNTTRLVLTFGWRYEIVNESGSSQSGYGDLDQDQLLDISEFRYNLSNPESYNATTDGVYWNGTSPTNPDSDGDGIIDGTNLTISKTNGLFQRWVPRNILYVDNENGTVTFIGETSIGTDCLAVDSDGDGSTDGQEKFGFTVVVSWFDDGELKSEEVTVFGHPLMAFMEPDGTTPLDTDNDTIPDRDEADPWNSTDYAYYVNHPDVNETDVEDQFNPFIRENVPPRVLNLKIKSREKWDWIVVGIVPVYVCTHAWTEISVEVIEVSNFTLEVRIDDYSNRYVVLEGEGLAWYEVSLDLDYVMDVLLDYTVKISAWDVNGNALDPPLSKTVEGFFGGIINALSEFWDWIVGVAQAIGEAILEALSFVIDWLWGIITSAVDALVKPIVEGLRSWGMQIANAFESVITPHSLPMASADPYNAMRDVRRAFYSGHYFLFVLSLGFGVTMAGYLFSAATMGSSVTMTPFVDKLSNFVAYALFGIVLSGAVFAGAEIMKYLISLAYPNDPFWAEQVTLAAISLLSFLFLYLAQGAISWDLVGLAISIAGLGLVIASASASEETALLVSAAGTFLALFGFGLTLPWDPVSDNPFSAFGAFDEVLTTVGAAVALADYLKVAEEYLGP